MQRHIECDVAVVGGGAAGIAAAIGASRAGARTVLRYVIYHKFFLLLLFFP